MVICYKTFLFCAEGFQTLHYIYYSAMSFFLSCISFSKPSAPSSALLVSESNIQAKKTVPQIKLDNTLFALYFFRYKISQRNRCLDGSRTTEALWWHVLYRNRYLRVRCSNLGDYYSRRASIAPGRQRCPSLGSANEQHPAFLPWLCRETATTLLEDGPP